MKVSKQNNGYVVAISGVDCTTYYYGDTKESLIEQMEESRSKMIGVMIDLWMSKKYKYIGYVEQNIDIWSEAIKELESTPF